MPVPSVPRIRRVVPQGPITRSEQQLPVIATLEWEDGVQEEVLALAIAWTREAVEVDWETRAISRRTDWVPATQVRRTLEKQARELDEPTSTRGRSRSGRLP